MTGLTGKCHLGPKHLVLPVKCLAVLYIMVTKVFLYSDESGTVVKARGMIFYFKKYEKLTSGSSFL